MYFTSVLFWDFTQRRLPNTADLTPRRKSEVAYMCFANTWCPTRYRTRHFFNNLPLMMILQWNLKRTTDTFLFISHTTNVLLFKFRCNIFIDVRIIKEMPGSVGSGTQCTHFGSQLSWMVRLFRHCRYKQLLILFFLTHLTLKSSGRKHK